MTAPKDEVPWTIERAIAEVERSTSQFADSSWRLMYPVPGAVTRSAISFLHQNKRLIFSGDALRITESIP